MVTDTIPLGILPGQYEEIVQEVKGIREAVMRLMATNYLTKIVNGY